MDSKTSVRLPTEVWRLILRYASYDTDLLSTSWTYEPDDRLWANWEYYFDSPDTPEMRTKRVLVQVNRKWRHIATEFLYEAIHIPSNSERFARIGNLVNAF